MKKVDIYTDGSCKKNPGPGGWAAVLCFDGREKEICGGEENTTNNRMELTAVISALKMLREPCEVTLTTDSKYVSDGITLGWAKSWKKNGWKKSDKSPALNPELWEELLSLCEKHKVEFVWVKGHAGHPYNERCDTMAQSEAAKFAKKKIGLLVAIETDSVFDYYKNVEALPCPRGYKLYKTGSGGREIYILRTGMGLAAAAAGTQYLISECGAQTIVNFGVVGGLTEDMKKEKVCVVDRVVHYKYDCSEFMDLRIGQVDGHDSIYLAADKKMVKGALEAVPDLKKVTCCSGDKFVATAEEKKSIHEKFEGDVCDMESAGIVLTCEMNGVPCLLLKAVSDGLSDGAGGFYEELKTAADKCLAAAGKIIESL